MKNILFVLFLLITSFAIAQEVSPPAIVIPNVKNKALIDELIKVTYFEKYFERYCKKRVEQATKENNWDENRKKAILESINFEYFKSSIYSAFGTDSKENLNKAIALFKSMNENRNDDVLRFIPINEMIQFNLDGFVRSLIEGKLILNKK